MIYGFISGGPIWSAVGASRHSKNDGHNHRYMHVVPCARVVYTIIWGIQYSQAHVNWVGLDTQITHSGPNWHQPICVILYGYYWTIKHSLVPPQIAFHRRTDVGPTSAHPSVQRWLPTLGQQLFDRRTNVGPTSASHRWKLYSMYSISQSDDVHW